MTPIPYCESAPQILDDTVHDLSAVATLVEGSFWYYPSIYSYVSQMMCLHSDIPNILLNKLLIKPRVLRVLSIVSSVICPHFYVQWLVLIVGFLVNNISQFLLSLGEKVLSPPQPSFYGPGFTAIYYFVTAVLSTYVSFRLRWSLVHPWKGHEGTEGE